MSYLKKLFLISFYLLSSYLLAQENLLFFNGKLYPQCKSLEFPIINSQGHFISGCIEGNFTYLFLGQKIYLDQIYQAGDKIDLFTARVKVDTKIIFPHKTITLKGQTVISFYPNGNLAQATFSNLNFYKILDQLITIKDEAIFYQSGKLHVATLAKNITVSCENGTHINLKQNERVEFLESGYISNDSIFCSDN